MAEIYRDSSVTLSLGITSATAVSAVIKRDGVTVATPSILTGNTITVPFSVVGFDGPFTIYWTFTYQSITTTRQETYEVVTPYVTVAEARTELNLPDSVTDSQIIRLERRIRKVIEQICNQEFGLYPDTKIVLGRNDVNLALPERLINLVSIAGTALNTDITLYDIRGDGFYLALTGPVLGDSIYSGRIEAPPAPWYTSENKILGDPLGVIHLPTWRDGEKYTINGLWGYESVPENIKEAVLILIEQALCPDSTYRDRYIEDVTYADSSYSFNAAAFSPSTTGNAVADTLIAEYIRVKFTVI